MVRSEFVKIIRIRIDQDPPTVFMVIKRETLVVYTVVQIKEQINDRKYQNSNSQKY